MRKGSPFLRTALFMMLFLYKGNYYYIEDIAKSSETKEEYVVYRALYGDDQALWIRPKKMFLEEIPDRPDNITGQKHRFELVEDLSKDYIKNK